MTTSQVRSFLAYRYTLDTVNSPPTRHSNARHQTYDCNGGCPVEAALEVIGGKWKAIVIHHLLETDVLRFNELKRRTGSVTQRMLTRQLRELESDGLITRTVHPVVPPHVDYALTPMGRRLGPIISALRAFGQTEVLGRT